MDLWWGVFYHKNLNLYDKISSDIIRYRKVYEFVLKHLVASVTLYYIFISYTLLMLVSSKLHNTHTKLCLGFFCLLPVVLMWTCLHWSRFDEFFRVKVIRGMVSFSPNRNRQCGQKSTAYCRSCLDNPNLTISPDYLSISGNTELIYRLATTEIQNLCGNDGIRSREDLANDGIQLTIVGYWRLTNAYYCFFDRMARHRNETDVSKSIKDEFCSIKSQAASAGIF